MPSILIKDIKDNLAQSITLRGWVFNFRSSGKIYFLQIRDGSGVIQAIVSQAEVNEKVWHTATASRFLPELPCIFA